VNRPPGKVVAIIQARMGSTRLPGKVLSDLHGRTMLARVVRRVGRARNIQQVLVAATEGQVDEPIVAECRSLGVPCFRGSEDDVLDRYHAAAAASGADVVVRITSDCPLIDPDVTDQVVAAFLHSDAHYASNTLQRTWPQGLDTEAFHAAALNVAWREARQPYERAHVTPCFYQHPERFRLLSVTGPEDHSQGRWTVDTAEDLDFARTVYERLDRDDAFSWRYVLELLAREPAIAALNRHVRQKRLEEG